MTIPVDEIKQLAQRAHRDAAVRAGLFETLFGTDLAEARRAAWALTHLPASDNGYIDSRRSHLVQLAVGTDDTSLRRLALALLQRLDWPEEAVQTDLLDFCLRHAQLREEPCGVRSLCIKLAFLQCRHYAELREELRQGLLLMEPAELSAGVKHIRGKILNLL